VGRRGQLKCGEMIGLDDACIDLPACSYAIATASLSSTGELLVGIFYPYSARYVVLGAIQLRARLQVQSAHWESLN
jgi:hypothetical protein